MELVFWGNEKETSEFCVICNRLKELDFNFESDYKSVGKSQHRGKISALE